MADLLTPVLLSPTAAREMPEAGWDLLIRQARRANLLARLDLALQEAGVAVPRGPAEHLAAARILVQAQREEVRRELRSLLESLAPLQVPVVLLKGAAYVAADLPPARGRLFSDIDILVPKERLAEVEACPMTLGWATTHLSAYDQRYYRRWMHELPPMVHMRRGTGLDIHHNILPLTSRTPLDAAQLLRGAVSLHDRALPGASVLAPSDMVLHSLVHLFHNEETANALRDLSDIDLLLRHWGRDLSFWTTLVERAQRLGLERFLFDGLLHVQRVFHSPLPPSLAACVAEQTGRSWRRRWVTAAWSRALAPPHPSCDGWAGPLARQLLYARAHWLRMPPWLLGLHLTVKALGLHKPPELRIVAPATQAGDRTQRPG